MTDIDTILEMQLLLHQYDDLKAKALAIADDMQCAGYGSLGLRYPEWAVMTIIDGICHIKSIDIESDYYGDWSAEQQTISFPAKLLLSEQKEQK